MAIQSRVWAMDLSIRRLPCAVPLEAARQRDTYQRRHNTRSHGFAPPAHPRHRGRDCRLRRRRAGISADAASGRRDLRRAPQAVRRPAEALSEQQIQVRRPGGAAAGRDPGAAGAQRRLHHPDPRARRRWRPSPRPPSATPARRSRRRSCTPGVVTNMDDDARARAFFAGKGVPPAASAARRSAGASTSARSRRRARSTRRPRWRSPPASPRPIRRPSDARPPPRRSSPSSPRSSPARPARRRRCATPPPASRPSTPTTPRRGSIPTTTSAPNDTGLQPSELNLPMQQLRTERLPDLSSDIDGMPALLARLSPHRDHRRRRGDPRHRRACRHRHEHLRRGPGDPVLPRPRLPLARRRRARPRPAALHRPLHQPGRARPGA